MFRCACFGVLTGIPDLLSLIIFFNYFVVLVLDMLSPLTLFRNYVKGTCGRNTCECCQCCLTEMQLVYDGCHRFCPNCISVTVIAQTRGEGVAQFLQNQNIRCGYCNLPLDQNALPPLMTTDALKSWQDAMCTAAALESEKETELRLRASIQAAQHPDIAILSAIEGMVLPKCPACQRFLPAFDGCCALQCGDVSGKVTC